MVSFVSLNYSIFFFLNSLLSYNPHYRTESQLKHLILLYLSHSYALLFSLDVWWLGGCGFED